MLLLHILQISLPALKFEVSEERKTWALDSCKTNNAPVPPKIEFLAVTLQVTTAFWLTAPFLGLLLSASFHFKRPTEQETSARAWCTGKTQRDRVEREVGGGIRMGNTCKSMADSCQCMAKTTTIL